MIVQRGAKHLAFMSRSGASKPLAASLIRRLEKQGVKVMMFKSDVANRKDVEALKERIDHSYPIRGIVNAAMVLDVSIRPGIRMIQVTKCSRTGCSIT